MTNSVMMLLVWTHLIPFVIFHYGHDAHCHCTKWRIHSDMASTCCIGVLYLQQLPLLCSHKSNREPAEADA